MSQGNWGGPPPGGGGWGGGGPPGAPPGGGYGPPPGGGGYGPPPGGGYGAPPGGGGYGAPPGGGGYGAPPGGGYGPPAGAPPGAMAPVGARAQFNGEGGNLLVTYLLWGVAPVLAGSFTMAGLSFIGGLIDGGSAPAKHGHHAAQHGPGAIAMAFSGTGVLIYLACAIVGTLIFTNKFIGFRWDNLVLDGQKCEYKGTPGALAKIYVINMLLILVTAGIYTPWAWCKMHQFTYENTLVGGQPNRLTFSGSGGELLGRYILGMILTICTFYIYGAWFANDMFAFFWENSKLDGRGFGFRKDPGGFLGTYILFALLTFCTGGIYYPWGICNILKWEAERVS